MFINELVDEWVGVGPDGIRWSECFFNYNSKTEIFLLNKLIIDYFADYPLALVHVRASIETFEGTEGGDWSNPVGNMLHYMYNGLSEDWAREVWEWWHPAVSSA